MQRQVLERRHRHGAFGLQILGQRLAELTFARVCIDRGNQRLGRPIVAQLAQAGSPDHQILQIGKPDGAAALGRIGRQSAFKELCRARHALVRIEQHRRPNAVLLAHLQQLEHAVMVVDAALIPLHAPPADLDAQRLESCLREQTHRQFVVPRRRPVHADAGEEIDGRLGLKVSPPRLLVVAVLWPGAIQLRRVHIRPVRRGGRRHGRRSPDKQRDPDQAIHKHILSAAGKFLGGWQVAGLCHRLICRGNRHMVCSLQKAANTKGGMTSNLPKRVITRTTGEIKHRSDFHRMLDWRGRRGSASSLNTATLRRKRSLTSPPFRRSI